VTIVIAQQLSTVFVSDDAKEALFTYIQREPSSSAQPDPILISGLALNRSYEVKPIFPAGKPGQMYTW